jgi:hypothetical protein
MIAVDPKFGHITLNRVFIDGLLRRLETKMRKFILLWVINRIIKIILNDGFIKRIETSHR